MKFSLLYEELKFSDVFSAASPEEVSDRKEKLSAMKIAERLDKVSKVKLSDGTWHVTDDLDLSCDVLTSLKSLNVSIVNGDFKCFRNDLTSLEGCPKEVGGDFICSDNYKKFTEDEVRSICNVKGSIFI